MVVTVLLATACGGGGGEVIQGGPPTSAPAPEPPGASTTSPPSTSAPATTARASTATTVRRTEPGPPQPPMTGTLAPPTTARPVTPYLPSSVVDNVFPPDTPAAQLLSAGQCSLLLQRIVGDATHTPWKAPAFPVADPVIFLYRAAAEACLSRWADAERDFRQVSPPPTFQTVICDSEGGSATCVAARKLVYDWTAAMLAAHRADPAFVPNFKFPPT